MLQREIEKKLIEWKNKKNKKALCIIGARQIGKTTLVRGFAKKNYDYFCELNFFENPRAKEIFANDLDVNTIITGISAFLKMKLEPGKTLIFFDEVQQCPNVRCAIKFLVEDGRFDYIESGSLLGVNISDIPSLPVGFEEEYVMYPMSFKEFVIANGIQESTLSYLENCYNNLEKVNEAIHHTMLKLFYTYLVVGGMPEAVQIFVDTHDIAKVIEYQEMIINKYRQDISQYSTKSEKEKIKAIFDSIPSQLNQKNKRFMINSLDKNARLLRYQDCFNWLFDAGVALPCYNIMAPILPLELNTKRNLFKMYYGDTGLLSAATMSDIQFDILQGNLEINLGSILENVVAQELKHNGFDLYYYDGTKVGEIDFVIKMNNNITLIEVKSGHTYTDHKALDNAMAIKEWNIKKSFILCKGNVMKEKSIYLPWYMIMFIKNKKIEKMIYDFEINNIQ